MEFFNALRLLYDKAKVGNPVVLQTKFCRGLVNKKLVELLILQSNNYSIEELKQAVLKNHEKLITIAMRVGADLPFKMDGLAQSSEKSNKETLEDLQARGIQKKGVTGN